MKSQINYVEIGTRIRIEREKFDISREKLSELLGLSSYYIGQIERGDRKMSIETLISLSKCLHFSIDYLVYGSAHVQIAENNLTLLINKCSENECKIIEEIVKVILPHI